MLRKQLLARTNDTTQICLHQLTYEVDVTEDFTLFRNVDNVEEAEDVLVDTILHDDNFTEDSLGINLMTGERQNNESTTVSLWEYDALTKSSTCDSFLMAICSPVSRLRAEMTEP